MGKGNGCWKIFKKIESREKEWFRERERKRDNFIESLCREQPEVGNPKPTLQISCESKWGQAQQPHFRRVHTHTHIYIYMILI